MIVGCYSLHLYCRFRMRTGHPRLGYKEPLELTAETGAECRRNARRIGWRLNMISMEATCPICIKEHIR